MVPWISSQAAANTNVLEREMEGEREKKKEMEMEREKKREGVREIERGEGRRAEERTDPFNSSLPLLEREVTELKS